MRSGAVVPGDLCDCPSHLILFKDGFQGWPPCAFQSRPAVLTRLTEWCWYIQGGVQAQSGDQGDGLTQGLAAAERIQHGIAVVPHQHQGAMGKPAWFGKLTMSGLHDHLTGPVGDLFVATALLLVVARCRRQHREHRQGPVPSGPGHRAQPHPAQTTGLDQWTATGAHRVPVDASGLDLGATSPLQGFIYAEDQRTVAAIQVLK